MTETRTYTVGDLPRGWREGAHCTPGMKGWAGLAAGWWIIRNRDGAAIQMTPEDSWTREQMNDEADAAILDRQAAARYDA